MWRDKFARRLADSQRRRSARDAEIARRRGTEPPPDMDDPDAEQRAMQEDEEVSEGRPAGPRPKPSLCTLSRMGRWMWMLNYGWLDGSLRSPHC